MAERNSSDISACESRSDSYRDRTWRTAERTCCGGEAVRPHVPMMTLLGIMARAVFASGANGPPPAGTAQENNSTEQNYLTPVEAKFSADVTLLYVVCEDDDSLLAVNVKRQRVVSKVRVGHKPKDVAVSPDGKTLYVTNEWRDTVSEIDAAKFEVRRTLTTGWGPIGVTTDRSGKILYVANSISNDVSLIDLEKGAEIRRLAAWRSPHHVAPARDGRHVFV